MTAITAGIKHSADLEDALRLFVVVPCFNEARGIAPTLNALAVQTDHYFELVLVDNGSTDDTRRILWEFRDRALAFPVHCISEEQKGTGSAADTGFRYAIAAGATHIARTDADCLPSRSWIANIKQAFRNGTEFVAGRIRYRSDDCHLGRFEIVRLHAITAMAASVAPLLPHNRGDFKARYVLASGGNLATTAALYLAAGGFPRCRLEDANEDRELANRVRRLTTKVRRVRSVVVEQSARRIRHYGLRNAILWYWNRKYHPTEIDVR